ncbi:MAG: cell division protein ZipA C-terminal FtsZ-binding domain-containing protein [Gammaproteobacteria bacterium]
MALRVSLLLIGCIIILLIYLFSRRGLVRDDVYSRRKSLFSGLWENIRSRLQRDNAPDFTQTQEVQTPRMPEIDPGELDQLETIIPERGREEFSPEESSVIIELSSEQIAPAGEQLFIPLTIMGRKGTAIQGDSIERAVRTVGLVLKDDGIYRYMVKDGQGYQQVLLGLANILEPGTFDAEQIKTISTPGLVLYLHLPAPVEAREAFDTLVDIGHKLAQLLDAELCDETRSVLTRQTIGHLKEKIEAFRFKQKMTQLQRRQT